MHLLVWTVYSLAAFLVLACVWWSSRGLTGPLLRWSILLVLLALLFTPVQLAYEPLWWAPVIAAIALELLAGDMNAALSYLPLLFVTLAVAVVFVALLAFLSHKRINKR